MGNFNNALDRLSEAFEGFARELRDMADEVPVKDNLVFGHAAGFGEEAEDEGKVVDFPPAERDDLDDDTMVQIRSGDLRHVIDAYRKLVRFAREGYIPTQDERMALHQHIRKVKHLIRKPHRHAA